MPSIVRFLPPLALKTKFAIVIGAMILAVVVLITTFLTHQQETTIRDGLTRQAVALTENVAYNCQLPLVTQNAASLQRLGLGLLEHDEVVSVQFEDDQAVPIIRVGADLDSLHLNAESSEQYASGTRTAWMRADSGMRYLEVLAPVTLEAARDDDILAPKSEVEQSERIGSVRLRMTTQGAEDRIAAMSQLAGVLGIVVALAGSIAAAMVVHRIIRPLAQLMEGNRRVARGDFSLWLEVRSRDEFGQLAVSWNQMANEIQRSRQLAGSYLESLRANTEKLEEANRTLLHKNEEIAKASRMKSEFLAIMSHELRTPLNGIIGFSEVLLDEKFGKLNDKQRRFTENTITSGRHLLRLINDLLDLSKIEAGKMEVVPQPLDLTQSLEEIQVLVRNLSLKKGIQLHCGPVPQRIAHSDPKLFKQVMFNLLSNAIKFTPVDGRVDVAVRCLSGAELRAEPVSHVLPVGRREAIADADHVLVEVRDTGIGIAPEDHEKIFVPFQQLDSSYARLQEGTGLGLALTRRIVRLLGGEIWFTSQRQAGSCFIFFIPLEYTGEAVEHVPDMGASEAVPSADVSEAPVAAAAVEPDATVEPAVDSEEQIERVLWPWGEKPARVKGTLSTAAETPQTPVLGGRSA